MSNSSLFTPALLRTHSFVFCAVHETRRIFLILDDDDDELLYPVTRHHPSRRWVTNRLVDESEAG